MACKDIIVKINDYDPANTYTVTVRAQGTPDNTPAPSLYTQIATSNTVIFKGIQDGSYQVCIQKICKDGGRSIKLCKDVHAPTCSPPRNLAISAVTDTTATVAYDADSANTFEYRLDNGEWQAAGATGDDLTDLITGQVYIYEVRKKCGTYDRSVPARGIIATSDGTPVFKVTVLERICNGNVFEGYRLRFHFTGGIAAEGSTYTVRYTTYVGEINTVASQAVTSGMTLDDMVRAIASYFHAENFIIDLNDQYGSFDIISKEQKTSPGMEANCASIGETDTAYEVFIT